MRRRLVAWLAPIVLGHVGLVALTASCSLLTDLSGLSGGPFACKGGACTDGATDDARGGEGGGPDAGPCVPTDTIAPSLLSDAVSLALGKGFSCALRTNGSVACWGENGDGVLAVQGGNRPTAGTLPGLSRIVAITAGNSFACALDADGHVWCWGDNTFGQLGSFAPNPGSHPPTMVMASDGKPLAGVTKIAAGDFHVCAIVSSAVWCWGANDSFQLGRSPTNSAPAPIMTTLTEPSELAVAGKYSCVVADDTVPSVRALYCWGNNDDNELAYLGGNTATPQKIPVSLAPPGASPIVAAGHGHTCARDDKDALRCWGENDFGQLGASVAPGSSPVPRTIDALGMVRTAAAGDDFTCAVATDGTTRCLGENGAAQLGNGAVDTAPSDGGLSPPHTEATLVSGLPAASRIAAGTAHACAILARSCPDVPGAVMCWGDNGSGALGNGTTKATRVPVPVLTP